MKKILSYICVLILSLSLFGCGEKATNTEATDNKGNTVTGKVTAIDGTSVTLTLGELSEMQPGDMPERGERPEGDKEGKEPPQRPEGSDQNPPEKPDGKPSEETDATSQATEEKARPEGEADGTDGEASEDTDATSQATEQRERPEGMPDKPDGDGQPPQMPEGGMQEFTEGSESKTYDLKDAKITSSFGSETKEVALSDIRVDTVLTLELDNDGNVKNVTIIPTMGTKPKDSGDSEKTL